MWWIHTGLATATPTQHGFELVHPPIVAEELHDVDVADDGTVWAVGAYGAVVRMKPQGDGTVAIDVLPSPSNGKPGWGEMSPGDRYRRKGLGRVLAHSATDAWVVDSMGVDVFHFDGTTWAYHDTAWVGSKATKAPDGGIWEWSMPFMGGCTERMAHLRREGERITTQPGPKLPCGSAEALAWNRKTLWATGKQGAVWTLGKRVRNAPRSKVELKELAFDDEGTAWGLGDLWIYRLDKKRWNPVTDRWASLSDITFVPGDPSLWVVGAQVWRHDGTSLAPVPLAASPKLNSHDRKQFQAIAGRGPDDVWVVGARGRILHWDGQALLDVRGRATEQDLVGLAWVGEDGWLVASEDGMLLEGTLSKGLINPHRGPLTSARQLVQLASGEIVLSGRDTQGCRRLVRSSADPTWQEINLGDGTPCEAPVRPPHEVDSTEYRFDDALVDRLTSVATDSEGRVWAVGRHGAAVRSVDMPVTSFEALDTGVSASLTGIYPHPSGQLVVIGRDGVILQRGTEDGPAPAPRPVGPVRAYRSDRDPTSGFSDIEQPATFEAEVTAWPWHRLTRQTGGLVERYFTPDALPTPMEPRPRATPVDAEARRCAEDGVCNVTLLPGAHWPALEPPVDHVWRIEVREPVRLDELVRTCRVDDAFVWLNPGGSSRSDWLAPIAVQPTQNETVLPARYVRVHAGGDEVVPPPCELRSGARTMILGGSANHFGLFVVRPEDVQAIGKAGGLQAAYNRASQRAVHQWDATPRFCEDPVRVTLRVGLGGPGTPLVGEVVEDQEVLAHYRAQQAELMESVNLWNLRMYRRYEPDVCERSLERMLTALALAHEQGLRIHHFGY